MAKVSLKNYIERIEKAYQARKKEWIKLQKELAKAENDYKERMIKVNSLGTEEVIMEYNEKKKEILFKLAKLREQFHTDVVGIIKDSDKIFDDLYCYNPSKVDNNGLKILENGGMTPSEIINMADGYKARGNMTMYFLCAEKLRTLANKPSDHLSVEELKAKAFYSIARQQREEREDHDLLEGYELWCLASLRDDVMLSEGIDNIHDTEYARKLETAQSITVDTVMPWD